MWTKRITNSNFKNINLNNYQSVQKCNDRKRNVDCAWKVSVKRLEFESLILFNTVIPVSTTCV